MSKTRTSFEANVNPVIRDALVARGIDLNDPYAAITNGVSMYNPDSGIISALQNKYLETDDSPEAGMLAMEYSQDEYFRAYTYFQNENNWQTFQNDFMSTEDSVINPQSPQTIIDTVNDVSQNGQVCIAIDGSSLVEVLDDGRFQTQFETGTTGGILDNQGRILDEFRTQGVEKDAPAEERPIYGYLISDTEGRDISAHSDMVFQGLTSDDLTSEQERDANLLRTELYTQSITSIINPQADQYGSIRVVLKDSVSENTTFTLGDSLRESKFSAPMGTTVTESVAVQQGLADAVDSPDEIGYIEAQVHGGVSVSDIQTIYAPDESTLQSIKGVLQEKGLTIPVQLIPEDKP